MFDFLTTYKMYNHRLMQEFGKIENNKNFHYHFLNERGIKYIE